jgi:DNA-binding MurR/RpiR family transcriptional regulator
MNSGQKAAHRHRAVTESGSPTVAELIQSCMDKLRPAERRVARALLADYPSAGLGTVANLAEQVGVSAPSVMRFAQALGFDGFGSLQTSLRAELTQRSNGPLGRIRWQAEEGSNSELLIRRTRELYDFVHASLAAIPPADLDAAVDLLADSSRRLFLSGGRFSQMVAEYLSLHLEQIRPRVRLLEDPLGRDLGHIVDITRRDVYLLCDFRRYQRSTIELAHQVHRQGATIVLVTDEHLSPIAAKATVVLPVSVSSPSPFDSMAAALVLAELLVIPVLDRLGEAGKARMSKWEDHRSQELVP